jgi:putative ABC transport system permease protein
VSVEPGDIHALRRVGFRSTSWYAEEDDQTAGVDRLLTTTVTHKPLSDQTWEHGECLENGQKHRNTLVYASPAAANGLVPAQSSAEIHARQTQVNTLAAALDAQSVLTLSAAFDPTAANQSLQPGPTVANPSAQSGPTAANLSAQPGLLIGKPTAALLQVVTHGFFLAAQLDVATPALLHHYGIKPSEIDPTADILTSRTGLAGLPNLELDSNAEDCVTRRCKIRHPKIQTVNLPLYTADPTTLITVHAVHLLGLQLAPAGWLIQTAGPLTAVQVNDARQMAITAGAIIETKSSQLSLSALRNWVTIAGILLALGVLAMTVGLIRSETANDLRTLTAAGASSTTRRTLTSATAGALALLGALLGTAVAYITAIAWYRNQLGTTVNHVPVFDLILILVGLPLIASTGAWLLAGREPPTMARQALE